MVLPRSGRDEEGPPTLESPRVSDDDPHLRAPLLSPPSNPPTRPRCYAIMIAHSSARARINLSTCRFPPEYRELALTPVKVAPWRRAVDACDRPRPQLSFLLESVCRARRRSLQSSSHRFPPASSRLGPIFRPRIRPDDPAPGCKSSAEESSASARQGALSRTPISLSSSSSLLHSPSFLLHLSPLPPARVRRCSCAPRSPPADPFRHQHSLASLSTERVRKIGLSVTSAVRTQ